MTRTNCNKACTVAVVAFIFCAAGFTYPANSNATRACAQVSATNSYGGNAILDVQAKRMGCRKAESVIRRAWRAGLESPGQRAQVGRYSCRYVRYYEPGRIALRCSFGRRVAKGYWTPEVFD
jgi:hypothetical protein